MIPYISLIIHIIFAVIAKTDHVKKPGTRVYTCPGQTCRMGRIYPLYTDRCRKDKVNTGWRAFLHLGFLFIQPHISEIEGHIDGNLHNIQHVEKPAQIKQPALPCSGGPQDYLPDNAEYIADPDEKFKEKAFSLCGAGNPGFPDGNGPGKAKSENHQRFQQIGKRNQSCHFHYTSPLPSVCSR